MLKTAAGPLILLTLLLLPGMEKGLWLDEYGAIAFAESGDHFFRLTSLYNTPPLYYLLLWGWRHLGEGEFIARLLSFPFAAATVWATYHTVARIRPQAAPWAGYFAACHPALLWQYQEIRPYSLLLGSTALAIYFGLRHRQQPSARWRIALMATVTVSLLTHTVALLAIPVWWVWARLPLRSAGILTVGGALVAGTVAWPFLGRADWWFPIPGFTLTQWILGSQSGLTQAHWGGEWVFLPLFGFVLLRGTRESWPFLGAYCWLWLSAIAITLWILPMMVPRTLTFFLLFLLPSLALALRSDWEKRIAVGLTVFWAAYWLIGPGTHAREPFKPLFTQLGRTIQPWDLLVLTPAHLHRLKVGEFYTGLDRGRWLPLGGERPEEKVPNQVAFQQALRTHLHRHRQFRTYLVVRKHLAPWVEELVTDYLGPADGEWQRDHLRVLRFTVNEAQRNELIRLYFPRPVLHPPMAAARATIRGG